MKLYDANGQEIDFDIPDKYKKVTVNCSGGADSSILLFMVAKYLMDEKRDDTIINVTSAANDFKHRWNVRKAADVINYTIDKLGHNQFDMHYSYYRDMQEVENFHAVEEQLFADGRVDLLASGITANPKVVALVENKHGIMIDLADEALEIRSPGDKFTLREGESRAYFTPFINVDKRMVASLYEQYDVMDMFDLTRSCEGVPDGKYDPEFEKTPCGKCWWCLERKWAFGRF